MADIGTENTAEFQLQHSTWLKRLAMELVGDKGLAQDLAQDTLDIFAEAERSGVRNPRSYMQRILRRLVHRRRTSEERRSHREHVASRTEAVPSAAEIAGQLETQRVLIGELQALPEASREVLVLRYLHDLSAVEIATRPNVPATTIRKRQSRALAELRERLDRKYPDRRSWAVALASLFETSSRRLPLKSSVPASVGLVAAKLLSPTAGLLAVCGVALLGLVALWGRSPEVPRVPTLEHPTEPVAAEVSAAVADSLVPPAGRVAVDAAPTGSAALERSASTGFATVRGQLQLSDGAPAGGADVSIVEGGSGDRAPALRGVADQHGVFEFHFLPGSGKFHDTYELSASYPGQVNLRYESVRVRRGAIVDMGVLTLAAPTVLLARVVGRQGETLADGWRVSGSALEGASGVLRHGVLDAGTGEFRLENLPSGEVSVSASWSNMGARTEPLIFPLLPWQETRARLMYRGPDLERRIAVRVRYSSVLLGQLDASCVTLQNESGEILHGKAVGGTRCLYVFDGLAPGQYTARVEDERFDDWSQAGVQPGEPLTARLTGSAVVRLTVLDDATDQPVLGGVFQGDPRNPASLEWSRNRFDFPPGELQHDGALLFRGLIPSSFDVVAQVPGYPEARAVVRNLRPGEQRSVTLRLHRTPALAGRVFEPDGVTPAAGVVVQRTSGGQAGGTQGATVYTSAGAIPPVCESTRTDAEGRFMFEGLAAATHTLRAQRGAWLVVDRVVDWSAESREEVDLTFPAFGWLDGRILIPEQRDLWELTLYLGFKDESGKRVELPTLPTELAGGDMNADGSFHLGPLPVGVLHLWYQCDGDGRTVHGMSNGMTLGDVPIRGGETARETFDLRETFPGLIRVRVHVDGELQTSGYIELNHAEVLSGIGRGFTDGFKVTGVIPGPLKVTYSPPGAAWRYCSPQRWIVHAGQLTEIELHVQQVAARLLIVDGKSGEPLSEAAVCWRSEGRPSILGDPSSHLASGVTDVDGYLDVQHPEGEYRFYRGAKAQWEDAHMTVAWPPNSNRMRVALPVGGLRSIR